MKTIYIIPGWDGNPNEPMLQWLKKELEKKEFLVEIPKMPAPSKPKINSWIKKLKLIAKNPGDKTYFIGHSIGCQAILRYLDSLNNIQTGRVVLIAPWMHLNEKTIEEEGEEIKQIAKPWIKTPINWNKIKSFTNNFVCIFSDNDPYVPLTEKDLFEKNLNAKIIIEHNRGHFDPGSGIKDNHMALNEILRISNS